jgi:hypothetical protein
MQHFLHDWFELLQSLDKYTTFCYALSNHYIPHHFILSLMILVRSPFLKQQKKEGEGGSRDGIRNQT